MAEKQLTDFEELLKKNSHIVKLRDEIATTCDGQKLGDIESAVLMFLTNIYIVHLGMDGSVSRSLQFNIRMLAILKKISEAEDNYKGRYKL